LSFLLHIIFIGTFITLFVVSVIILRPFRIHRKRPVSTIALKVSYLIYLMTFFLMAYLVLFFAYARAEDDNTIKNPFPVYYLAVILAFFVPNFGIIFRRKFEKFRVQYNYIFTLVNVVTILVLGLIIYSISKNY
jgi:hypothetical protein